MSHAVTNGNIQQPALTCCTLSAILQLSDKQLVTLLETEKAKLDDLRAKTGNKPLPESAVISPTENWDAMLPEVGNVFFLLLTV